MSRFLYIFSTTVLFFAVLLLLACGVKLLDKTEPQKRVAEASIIERFQTLGTTEASETKISPLVKRAEEFALLVNPPAAPEPVPAAGRPPQPVYTRPVFSASFRLLSTSCYLINPEKSLALVSEPGRGDHWVGKGERVGNFVVEKVEKGVLFYKDGNELHKMNVTSFETPQMSQVTAAEKPAAPETQIKPDTKSKTLFSAEGTRRVRRLSDNLEPAGYLTKE